MVVSFQFFLIFLIIFLAMWPYGIKKFQFNYLSTAAVRGNSRFPYFYLICKAAKPFAQNFYLSKRGYNTEVNSKVNI